MRSAGEVDPLDDLIGQEPEQVRDWMKAKAALADGHSPGLPVCGPNSIARAITRYVRENGEWVVERNQHVWRGPQVVHVGLLHDLGALTVERTGRVLDLGSSSVKRRLSLHRDLMRDDEDHQERVGQIASLALNQLS